MWYKGCRTEENQFKDYELKGTAYSSSGECLDDPKVLLDYAIEEDRGERRGTIVSILSNLIWIAIAGIIIVAIGAINGKV